MRVCKLLFLIIVLTGCSKPSDPAPYSYVGRWEGTWRAIGAPTTADFSLQVFADNTVSSFASCLDQHPSAGLILHRIISDMVIDEEGNLSGTMYYSYEFTETQRTYSNTGTVTGKLLTDGTGYGTGLVPLFDMTHEIKFECEKLTEWNQR